jgi:hypothetical protein
MTQIETRARKRQISEMLAIAAMILLLVHLADGSMERFINQHGFLPANINKRPFGLSNVGISSIVLFLLSFGIDDRRQKYKSNLTTTLLIVGGALIGTSALGVTVMDRGERMAAILVVSLIGYLIMCLGILRTIQQRRISSNIV